MICKRLGILLALIVMLGAWVSQSMATEITMYKNPNCGCCGAWAEHMRKAGFTVKEQPREDMDVIKSKYGVSEKMSSCHTAIVDGYVIEGHVPASDVKRLLEERPSIVGLSAPGMPMQSPGMQKEGLEPKKYDVLTISNDRAPTVYSHYD